MEKSYAVVDTATAKVVNVVVWDGQAEYDPGEGLRLVALDCPGGIGWDWNPKATKNKFIDNRPPQEMPW